jgi:hypothetical protein
MMTVTPHQCREAILFGIANGLVRFPERPPAKEPTDPRQPKPKKPDGRLKPRPPKYAAYREKGLKTIRRNYLRFRCPICERPRSHDWCTNCAHTTVRQ